jgi:hypothetical protein
LLNAQKKKNIEIFGVMSTKENMMILSSNNFRILSKKSDLLRFITRLKNEGRFVSLSTPGCAFMRRMILERRY